MCPLSGGSKPVVPGLAAPLNQFCSVMYLSLTIKSLKNIGSEMSLGNLIYTNVDKSETSLESERCGLQQRGALTQGGLEEIVPANLTPAPASLPCTCGEYPFPTQVLGC